MIRPKVESYLSSQNFGKPPVSCRLLNNDKMARNMENTVKQAQTTMANVHKTTGTLNEDLKAAQSNFLLKGFFKKKEKAKQDSLKKLKQDSAKAVKKLKKDSANKPKSQ